MNATFKHIRISPEKMRAVVNLVRGRKASTAVDTLTFCRRKGAGPVLKLVKSAVSNATQKGGVDVDNLFLKEIVVGNGPILKRWRSRSRGMANKELRRSCHISVELEER